MHPNPVLDFLGPAFKFAPPGDTNEAEEFCDKQLRELRQEYTSLDRVDYTVDSAAKVPLSFAQIQSVEQGFDWYRRHYPQYPQEVLMCMARAQFSPEAQAKKAAERKKAVPKPPPEPKPEPPRFSIERKPVEITFDDKPIFSCEEEKEEE